MLGHTWRREILTGRCGGQGQIPTGPTQRRLSISVLRSCLGDLRRNRLLYEPAWRGSSYHSHRRGSGRESKPRPEKIWRNSSSSASCTRPFDASVSRESSSNGEPSKRLILPPASSTMSAPAAVSHGLRLNSQKPSKRPQATLHKSRAADPARRTPCVRSVIWW